MLDLQGPPRCVAEPRILKTSPQAPEGSPCKASSSASEGSCVQLLGCLEGLADGDEKNARKLERFLTTNIYGDNMAELWGYVYP